MESERIKMLVECYLDGSTTKAEEAEIATYFATHSNVDAELEVVRGMFLGFSDMKRRIKAPVATAQPKVNRRMVWSLLGLSVAAATLLCVSLVGLHMINSDGEEFVEPEIICYVDGVAVEDSEVARQKVTQILGGVADNMNLAMASIERLNILSIE